MIYFTADLHLGHKLLSKMRGYESVEDMNKDIINTWNSIVKKGDTVYVVGDFAFGKIDEIKEYRNKLKGKIHLIMGGHDYRNKINRLGSMFSSFSDIKEVKFNHKTIVLCHYSMRVWNRSHYNTYHLYGHSHCKLEPIGKSFDIGWDCWKRPLSIYEVLELMEKRPDNINLVKKER